MALGKDKKRLEISLPDKQATWLKDFCKKHNLTPSKYISWLLYYKADEMIRILKLDTTDEYTYEELQEILHAKWID